MIYQLFVEDVLVAKGCRTLSEAMAYADEGVSKRCSCRIIAIGYASTFPAPIKEWCYDHDTREWVETDMN
ncbi:hypothetical protein [Leisingera sp.]|uniref:hypothetical protein n=1 Tax=Leisingera sp. TaxID=1879318 RepID=UPI003A8FBC97